MLGDQKFLDNVPKPSGRTLRYGEGQDQLPCQRTSPQGVSGKDNRDKKHADLDYFDDVVNPVFTLQSVPERTSQRDANERRDQHERLGAEFEFHVHHPKCPTTPRRVVRQSELGFSENGTPAKASRACGSLPREAPRHPYPSG